LNLKHEVLRLARNYLSVDIYRRNGHPWGERQMWHDLQRLISVARTIEPESVGMDVGAYRGDTVERIASIADFHEIHAFEPFPATFTRLEQRFSGSARVHLHKCALASYIGETRFHVTRSDQSNSILAPVPATSLNTSAHDELGEITVATSTIDHVAERHGIERVGFLKLDVQGAELAVLQGATRLLGESRVDVIACEIEFIELYKDQPLFLDVAAFAEANGLKLFGIYAPRPDIIGRIAWADVVFCREAVIATALRSAGA
jgi:FkbM family methyltransferase